MYTARLVCIVGEQRESAGVKEQSVPDAKSLRAFVKRWQFRPVSCELARKPRWHPLKRVRGSKRLTPWGCFYPLVGGRSTSGKEIKRFFNPSIFLLPVARDYSHLSSQKNLPSSKNRELSSPPQRASNCAELNSVQISRARFKLANVFPSQPNYETLSRRLMLTISSARIHDTHQNCLQRTQ